MNRTKVDNCVLLVGIIAVTSAIGFAQMPWISKHGLHTPKPKIDQTWSDPGAPVAVGDFDGDGFADKLLPESPAGQSGMSFILKNNRNGTYAASPIGHVSRNSVAHDPLIPAPAVFTTAVSFLAGPKVTDLFQNSLEITLASVLEKYPNATCKLIGAPAQDSPLPLKTVASVSLSKATGSFTTTNATLVSNPTPITKVASPSRLAVNFDHTSPSTLTMTLTCS